MTGTGAHHNCVPWPWRYVPGFGQVLPCQSQWSQSCQWQHRMGGEGGRRKAPWDNGPAEDQGVRPSTFTGQSRARGCQEREEQPAGRRAWHRAAKVLPGSRGAQTRGGDAAGTSHAIIRFIDAVLKKANQYIRFPKERKHQLPAAHNSSNAVHFSIKPPSHTCLCKMRSRSRQDLLLPRQPGQGQGHGHHFATRQSPCPPPWGEIQMGCSPNVGGLYQHHCGVWRDSAQQDKPSKVQWGALGTALIPMSLHHCMDLQS